MQENQLKRVADTAEQAASTTRESIPRAMPQETGERIMREIEAARAPVRKIEKEYWSKVPDYEMSTPETSKIIKLHAQKPSTARNQVKQIKDIYDARLIMLSFMSVGMIIPLALFLFTPYVEFKIYTDIYIWALIIFMAIISTASQWFLTRAYSISRASIIGVVSYTNIPFAIGFGIMLGDSLPDIYTFLGIIFIALGGIMVSKKTS